MNVFFPICFLVHFSGMCFHMCRCFFGRHCTERWRLLCDVCVSEVTAQCLPLGKNSILFLEKLFHSTLLFSYDRVPSWFRMNEARVHEFSIIIITTFRLNVTVNLLLFVIVVYKRNTYYLIYYHEFHLIFINIIDKQNGLPGTQLINKCIIFFTLVWPNFFSIY